MTDLETQLAEALRTEERFAPDPAAVLAGVHTGIARRRRRRRIHAVAAVALATVVAVAAGLAIAGGPGLNRSQPAATPSLPFEPPENREWKSTLTFEWLPEGLNPPSVGTSETGEHILYPGSGGLYLRLDVINGKWTPRLNLPGWNQVTVNGRPGRELSQPARSFVVFQLPSGRWADLELGQGFGTGGNHQPTLRRMAWRVAEGLRENGDTKLPIRFTPRYLPSGMRVVGVSHSDDTEAFPGYDELVCASDSLQVTGSKRMSDPAGSTFEHPEVARAKEVSIRATRRYEFHDTFIRSGRQIPDINGRPAYALDRQLLVVVFDFHGRVLTVQRHTGEVPLSELITIAAGVKWLG